MIRNIDGKKLKTDLKSLEIEHKTMCSHIGYSPTSLSIAIKNGRIKEENLIKIVSYLNRDKLIGGRFMYRPLVLIKIEDYIIKE